MKFSLNDLNWAVSEGIISQETCDNLVDGLREKHAGKPTFSMANVLYYFGGLIIIGAMTVYIVDVWNLMSGAEHLGIALGYAAVFLLIGNWLWSSKGQRTPGGILVTVAVCMTPMAVYGIHEMTGWWAFAMPAEYPDIFYLWESGWIAMSVATAIVGGLTLYRFRFPFITLPLFWSLWVLSMDVTVALFGPDTSWQLRKFASIGLGTVMLCGTYLVDRRTDEDFAFWGYLFGMLTFWGGLTALNNDSEIAKLGYCMVNLIFMGVSVLLQRRVFIIFGSMGVALYLGHLAYDVFEEQLGFTFILTLLGLGTIGLGVLYHKHEKRIEQALLAMLPERVKGSLPQFRN